MATKNPQLKAVRMPDVSVGMPAARGAMTHRKTMLTLSSASWLVSATTLLLVVSGARPASAGLYAPGDAVVQLNADNFERLVLNSDGVAVVEFYAPWCGHCQKLAPQYKKVASNLQGLAVVGAVDCDEAANKGLCARYQIQGYPTLKLFGSDRQKNPYTGELSKEAIDYRGSPTAKPIAAAVTALLTDVHISHVRSGADLEHFLSAHPGQDHVLLFSSKPESTTLYKALSQQLYTGLAFGEVHESVTEVVTRYKVATLPTLIVIRADGSHVVYDQELKAEQLKKFLSKFSQAPQNDSAGGGPAPPNGTGRSGNDGSAPRSLVVDLSLVSVADLDAKEDMWLLAFHGGGPSACPEAVAEFKAAVLVMQDIVKTAVVALEEAEYSEVSRYGASADRLASDPCALQLVLLPFGEEKAELDDYRLYRGPLEGRAMQAFVTEAVPTFATPIDAANADYFLAMGANQAVRGGAQAMLSSMAPKLLLLTNKDEVPGVYKALAMNFRERANMAFGWVQANDRRNAELVSRIKPPKIPFLTMLLMIPPQDGSHLESGQVPLSMQPYMGALKYNAMAEWLEKIVSMIEMMTGSASKGSAAALVPEVTDEASFQKYCTDTSPGLCILALLDSSIRHSDIEVQKSHLATVAATREGQPFSFAWTDVAHGRNRSALLRSIGLLSSDLPTVVVISPKRLRMAVMANEGGSGGGGADMFSAQQIGTFLDSVVAGQAKLVTLQALPTLSGEGRLVVEGMSRAGDVPVQETPLSEEEPVAEEFDLSDILSEEVEGSVMAGKAERLQQLEAEEQLKAAEAAEAAKKVKGKKKKKGSKKGSKASNKESESEL